MMRLLFFLLAAFVFLGQASLRASAATETETETETTTGEETTFSETETETATETSTAEETTVNEQTTNPESTTAAGTSQLSTTVAPTQFPVISCSTASDCPKSQPFCSPTANICQPCLSNNDCRASAHCNAVCVANNFNQNKCSTPVGAVRLQCTYNEVCYVNAASCQRKCIPSGNAANESAVACNDPSHTIPLGDQCDTQTGVCYDCLSNTDCGISVAATCNSTCTWNSVTYEYACSAGTICSAKQTCQLSSNLVASTNYACVNNNSRMIIASIALLVAVIAMTM